MKAPDFSLKDQNNQLHTLSDYKGKWLVIYFYPRDNTPGCTKEACAFRDFNQDISNLGVQILGVSKDSIKSHQNFSKKHKLNFPILSDPEHKILEAYGAWGEKKMYGRIFQGVFRYTFIINPDGEIVKHYKKVKPAEHPKQVYNDLKALIQ